MTLYTQILLRCDTAANWTTANPILGLGEYGYETDTKKGKYGDGATAWSSLPYGVLLPAAVATASTAVARDANANTQINNITESFATTATAAGTTTLTVASNPLQQFTGTLGQIVQLPAATTLITGFEFQIFNRSTGILTIKDGSGAVIQTMGGNSQCNFTCANIGTSAGLWDIAYSVPLNYLSVYAAGTAYSLTASNAELVFGTTSPSLTINTAGTYLIQGRANLKYNAATFAAAQTATLLLERTNNTPGAIANSNTANQLRILTTTTDSAGIIMMPPVIYTTVNSNDIIQIYGYLSAIPSAGSVQAVEACILATRLS